MASFGRKMERQQMRVSAGTQRRLVRDHQDVLQNIEAVLVASHRESRAVDDRACHAALEAILMHRSTDDPVVGLLVNGLEQIREMRPEIPSPTWDDALRVVAESIRNHSARGPGQKDYLAFVGAFMP